MIRTMRDERPSIGAPGIVIVLSADPKSESWNQIAIAGSWLGHPMGPFTIDGTTMQTMVRNFKATENRRLPVDYEHASEMPPAKVAVSGAPAIGWVVDLAIRGTDAEPELWALIQWQDETAIEHIREGRYRYLSPSIVFGAVDRVTGEPIGALLTSVGLVNQPFLDGMEPVTAKDPKGAAVPLAAGAGKPAVTCRWWDDGIRSVTDILAMLRDVLRLPLTADAAACRAAFDFIEAVAADPQRERAEGVPAGEFARIFREALRMPESAPAADVFRTIRTFLGDGASSSASTQAENTSMSDTAKTDTSATKYAALLRGLCTKLNVQCSEDASIETMETDIGKAVEALGKRIQELQVEEANRMRASATADVAVLCRAGVVDPSDDAALAAATELAMTDRPRFDALYGRKLSAANAAPAPVKTPANQPPQPTVADDVRRLLSGSVNGLGGANTPAPNSVPADASAKPDNAELHDKALRLMSERPTEFHDYASALKAAARL